MSKRTRHARGYYASLFEARDRSFTLKYRPRSKPSVMGFYEVERIVAKWVKAGREEYFVHWKNYSPAENTWERANHLPEELIAAFADKFVDPIRADESRERLALLFEKGLKSPGACNETITMRHDVLRSLFPGMPLPLTVQNGIQVALTKHHPSLLPPLDLKSSWCSATCYTYKPVHKEINIR